MVLGIRYIYFVRVSGQYVVGEVWVKGVVKCNVVWCGECRKVWCGVVTSGAVRVWAKSV